MTMTYAIEPDAHVWEWIWQKFKSTREGREAQDEALGTALRQIDSWSADSPSHIHEERQTSSPLPSHQGNCK